MKIVILDELCDFRASSPDSHRDNWKGDETLACKTSSDMFLSSVGIFGIWCQVHHCCLLVFTPVLTFHCDQCAALQPPTLISWKNTVATTKTGPRIKYLLSRSEQRSSHVWTTHVSISQSEASKDQHQPMRDQSSGQVMCGQHRSVSANQRPVRISISQWECVKSCVDNTQWGNC